MLKCYHFDNSSDAVHCDVYKLINDDPVRPHIPFLERFVNNRYVFCYRNENTKEIESIACSAITDDVAQREKDLFLFSESSATHVCMLYTLWSYKKGAGRELVFNLLDYVEEEMPHVSRVVTLSPMTDMAKRFHLNNNAVILQTNTDTVNFEYLVDRPEGVTA